MDAISFVLGVQSRDLRSSQMRDLIHRPPTGAVEGMACQATLFYEVPPKDDDDDDDDESTQEIRFCRKISAAGVGSYHVDDEQVSFQDYCKHLESISVLVQARNFLVFQGDVETLARKSPSELVALVETISGSASLKDDYQKAAQALQEAEQATLFGLKQQKRLRQERKLLQQKKAEADRFDHLVQQKRTLQQDLYLWLLFHLQQDQEQAKIAADEAKEELQADEENQAEAAKELAAAKKHASVSRRHAAQAEKKRVQIAASLDKLQPALVQTQEEIKTIQKKEKLDEKQLTKKTKEMETHEERLKAIDDEITEYRRTAEELQAEYDALKQQSQISLTADQEAKYERVREAAAASSAESRRQLQRQQTKLDTVRRKLDAQQVQLEEAVANRKQLQSDVAEAEERIDKFTKVRVYSLCPLGDKRLCILSFI